MIKELKDHIKVSLEMIGTGFMFILLTPLVAILVAAGLDDNVYDDYIG